MNTARREAVSRATRLADNGPVLVKRRNKANGRFPSRPKGVPQVTWHCVAVLGKGMPSPADCALFQVTWDALYSSNLGCSTTRPEMEAAEQYQRFISWQCRLRKMSVRELGGRPTEGMSAGVFSTSGGDEQGRLNFLIVRRQPAERTAEFRHIVRKSPDPGEWVKNGLRILSELHYHQDREFDDQLTALFSLDSNLSYALIKAGECHLKFAQDSADYAFDFDVVSLDQDDEIFEATYWHNRLFNPTLPGKVRVLGFRPRL